MPRSGSKRKGAGFYECECSICRIELLRIAEEGDRSKAMEARPSPIHGLGVFAKKTFKKGEFVIEYQGERITMEEADILEKRWATLGVKENFFFAIDGYKFVIDATYKGNISKMINHSCQPKCEARQIKVEGKTRVLFYAVKTIHPGEELTIDFKFDKSQTPDVACNCKSDRCRQFVDG